RWSDGKSAHISFSRFSGQTFHWRRDFSGQSARITSHCLVPRNRFRERCRKGVRRSKRRIGLLYCKRAGRIRTNLGERRLPVFVKPTGHLSTLLLGVAVIRRLMRRTSCKTSSSIWWKKKR